LVNQANMNKQDTDPAEETPLSPMPVDGADPTAPATSEHLEEAVPPQPIAGRPSVSPDGGTIAIVLIDDAGVARLWLAPVDGSEREALDTDVEVRLDLNPEGPQWSPDGFQLALTAPHPADGRPAIWVITPATKAVRLLVDHDARDSSPVWSPDGEWVAFLSRRFGRAAASIVRADGLGEPIQVSSARRGFDDHSLTWSRDSSKVGFAREAVDGDKVGDHIFTFDIRTGTTKQVTTRLCGRHSLTWAPDRNLIMHIADDSEWDNIAVVNADNSSGWNIAAEQGDKANPRWSRDGQRVTYLRRMQGVVRCCERGTSTATSETIDPGQGVASGAQFLPDKRVLYVYQSATEGPRIVIQEPKEDAERAFLPIIPAWAPGRSLTTPVHQSFEIDGVTTGGLVYRWTEQEGDVPAVIVLRDRPGDAVTAGYDALEQAIAATGMAIYVPTLPGTPGEGRKVTKGLKDRAESEAETTDLLAFIDAVRGIGGIDGRRIAIAGNGHGAALALVLAGSRPGVVQAVAAVDPVCDWNIEFEHGDRSARDWLINNLGLPATSQGAYALRTPATYAGVIDVPLLLLGTDTAPAGRAAQLDGLTNLLRELDRPFEAAKGPSATAEREVANSEPSWTAMRRVATFLREALTIRAPVAEPLGEAVTADAV
jgi:dipeptidyl aminopeptidase/acylaminoacyl peptidase